MLDGIPSPAQATYWSIPGSVLFSVVAFIGLACFAYIVARRLTPLFRAERDVRFDRPLVRLERVLKYWLGQWKHPRFRFAGSMHILIFAGFLILAFQAFSLLIVGTSGDTVIAHFSEMAGRSYGIVKDYAATIVFLCMVIAATRRIVFKPARYEVPERYGRGHKADAIFLLALIATLMASESLFEASKASMQAQQGQAVGFLAFLSLPWMMKNALSTVSPATLWNTYRGAYLVDVLTFYFLLCYRPFGIQFHVETSLFNVYFAKLDRGTVKPVRWGVDLDKVKSFGVKTFEDFTWKHMLDFYSCADCGRCSDQCPANAVGRPLSPRFLTTKARDYSFQHYPVVGAVGNGTPLIGSIYSEDEIWSCTTCGACEEECPLLIEYIDKIVDLRRGMVDDGNVPKSLQKPLKALESRGNPYGKMEKKRAEWTKAADFQKNCTVPVLNGSTGADTLYFVDSITSYDDRMQSIGRATARILDHVGANFGILGAAEKDSGHEVRRFGEETLFMALRDDNVEAIKASGVQRIVTSDPHAYQRAKARLQRCAAGGAHQPVHRSRSEGRAKSSSIRLKTATKSTPTTIPAISGRHNQVYDDPREVLDAIPGLKRVEMTRSRDRALCCGGGGLMLFYEPKEEQRIGVLRARMAADAGSQCDRDGLSVLHGEHGRCDQGGRAGRQDDGNRFDGTG